MSTKYLKDGTPICEIIPECMKKIVILCHGLGGNKNFFRPLEEDLIKINIGVISFDFPYHGDRRNKYTTYNVKNCLKTIDNVYKYVTEKYAGVKVSFIGNSLGSLYLYAYLIFKKPNVDKVIFECLPLNNKVKMIHDFFDNPKNTDKYFYVGYGRKLLKKLLDDLDSLEKELSDITCVNKENILFIHGTYDNVASLADVKNLCDKYHYNLYEIAKADHNFQINNSKDKLNNIIFNFLKDKNGAIEGSVFTIEKIKLEVKKHYGINVSYIDVINGGSANIYKLIDDNGEKFILKEFQSKFSGKTILKEINVINFLRKNGLPVPEYVSCLNGKQYFEYNEKTVIIQKYIEGTVKDNYSGDINQLLESAKYLGLIVRALEDYPYDDMFKCNIEKYTSDDIIDKSIIKHENLISLALKDEIYGAKIVKDLKDKIEMLKEIKVNGTFKKATNVTIKKTHGDYNVLQFIYDENDKIKSIIDFVSAGEMPIVWEIARSYNYIDKDCKNGEFNIDHLVMYVKEFLKYSNLNNDDLKYLPYIYLVQVLSSTYGYKEYLKSGNLKLLYFGIYRAKICRYLIKNANIISDRLLKINQQFHLKNDE